MANLWELPDSRLTATLTDAMEQNFYSRCPSEKRPRHMRDLVDSSIESEKEDTADPAKNSSQPGNSPVYDESVFKALHQTFFRRIWWSGLLLLASDTLKTTTPLVNKVLLTWLTESYVFSKLTQPERDAAVSAGFSPPKGVGYGIGLAFAIFIMQEASSLMANHYVLSQYIYTIDYPDAHLWLAAMTTGLYVRTAIIGNIFRKSLRLSGKSRTEHSVGKITTLISTDATRMDGLSYIGHQVWEAPVQLILGIGLLIGNIGYSALVGVAVFVVSLPVQTILVAIMYNQARKGIKITDQRVRLTTEVLQGIRLIKVYGWQKFYIDGIVKLRQQEIRRVGKSSIAVALLLAMFSFVPELAAVLSFITYALTKHDLNIAIIFSSLQLFNIIRIPLLLLPFAFSTVAEAAVALNRFTEFLTADELGEPYLIDPTQPLALKLDASFEWDTVPSLLDDDAKKEDDKDDPQKALAKVVEEKKKRKEEAKKKKQDAKKKKSGKTGEDELPVVDPKDQPDNASSEEKPFGLENLHIEIQKGSFVAIVGRVGSGKSSVLQAMIGEMKKTNGDVTFGGTIAYVPQSPWIRNATVRENIVFGCKDDDERFEEVIRACSLEHDLQILPHGERTEIGEKGITLSGGQKARVSLARAAYSQSDIVLLDDPLSAVDAYVGKNILEQCLLQGPLATRTRILVTHALHVLHTTDYIYVMDHGKIVEQGTYNDLVANSTVFSHLIEEYGNDLSGENRNKTSTNITQAGTGKSNKTIKDDVDDALMQAEERNTGAVSWEVWKKYLEMAVYEHFGIGNRNYWSCVLRLPVSRYYIRSLGNIVLRCLGLLSTLISGGQTSRFTVTVVALQRIYWLECIFKLRGFKSDLWNLYAETLTGLSTIRAYGEQNRSIKDAQHGLDMENRAFIMTIAMQRWLALRLEFFGNILVLGIGLFGAGLRTSVTPSKISVVMTYTLSVTQVFSEMISLFAQSEQNMNAVERVLHYTELPSERDDAEPIEPPESWPAEGIITFRDVKMAYRDNLPLVLKGISFKTTAGEKIGIVGRTGSGKSSLIQALLRLVEPQEGEIEIDGVDILRLHFNTLRTRIAFVPQDTTLFLGLRTDAELISILQRAWLLPKDGPVDPSVEAKFSLDSVVGDEGSNYSVGERQLLALCRALVKNSRIIILDEATSSVDAETDSKLQRTIQHEFASSTLLCIAHRLNTIAHYDRIIVMDDGRIAEFDTVLNLFDRADSIFRSLCEEAHLRRDDILKLRQEHFSK
ncbi:ABC-type transporter cicA [Psilocybe cubensis]|uniref:ABC-type transporter cicA n=1 Tax=Psilocybe cubensis TaxID=181762 RepID=A0ACB8GKW0_PSICU|nr:ABC-type transporter cicA [Psilocybe cubensis]KAH9476173.1 ABC-type transporter cicA [Psilocybe cubensis]